MSIFYLIQPLEPSLVPDIQHGWYSVNIVKIRKRERRVEGKERVHQAVLACSESRIAMGFVITRGHLRPQLCVISEFTVFLVQTFCGVTKGQDNRCDAAREKHSSQIRMGFLVQPVSLHPGTLPPLEE